MLSINCIVDGSRHSAIGLLPLPAGKEGAPAFHKVLSPDECKASDMLTPLSWMTFLRGGGHFGGLLRLGLTMAWPCESLL